MCSRRDATCPPSIELTPADGRNSPVDLVTLGKEELSKVRPVLTGDTWNVRAETCQSERAEGTCFSRSRASRSGRTRDEGHLALEVNVGSRVGRSHDVHGVGLKTAQSHRSWGSQLAGPDESWATDRKRSIEDRRREKELGTNRDGGGTHNFDLSHGSGEGVS